MAGEDQWDGAAFAKRVRVLMAERGIGPKELAASTGLSYAQVGRLLRGRPTPPSGPEVAAIAAILAVPVDELTQAGEAKRPDEPYEPYAAWMAAVERRLAQVEEREQARAEALERLVQRLADAGVLPAS